MMKVFRFLYSNGWPAVCSAAQFEGMSAVAEREKMTSPVQVVSEIVGPANLINVNGKHIWVELDGSSHEI